jgi:hypothetical protein
LNHQACFLLFKDNPGEVFFNIYVLQKQTFI